MKTVLHEVKKIVSKQDAKNLVMKAIEQDLSVVLWDKVDENRVLVIQRCEEPSYYTALIVDTVNGTESRERFHINMLVEIVWHNRKYINKSGQL